MCPFQVKKELFQKECYVLTCIWPFIRIKTFATDFENAQKLKKFERIKLQHTKQKTGAQKVTVLVTEKLTY